MKVTKKTLIINIAIIVAALVYHLTIDFTYAEMDLDSYIVVLPDRMVYYLTCFAVSYSTSLWLFPKFFNPKKPIVFIFALVSLFGIYCFLQWAYDYTWLADYLAPGIEGSTFTAEDFYGPRSYEFIMFFVFGMAYWLHKDSLYKKQVIAEVEIQKKELEIKNIEIESQKEAQKIKLEAEKAKAETELLKKQIHPHFLVNVLGFLYDKTNELHNEELGTCISKLTNILHYSLESREQALLSEEVTHIGNYITIQKLVGNGDYHIDFKVVGETENLQIIPLTLFSLVENCFKHGLLKRAADPVRIHLEITDELVTFTTRNRIKRQNKESSTGIGQNYIRKHLHSVYGSKHQFSAHDDGQYYDCQLTIQKEVILTKLNNSLPLYE